MRIVRVEVQLLPLRLAEPYTIAYETVTAADNVLLGLVPDVGPPGWGCSAPDLVLTGETAEQVRRDLEETAATVLVGQDPLRRNLLVQQLRQALPRRPATLAAVDMALFDLLGKVAGLPVWRILGGFRDRIETSITIGILPEEETVAQARERVRQGFRVLKLKGGRDVEGDVARVRRVREVVGKKIRIRFDANQGYSVEQAVRFVEETQTVGLEVLEQPTPRGEPGMLGRVAGQVPLPVMADESLVSLDDAFRLAREGLADMVNVKLMKVGGLDQALHVNSVAGAAGIEVMVGCMDEAALAIAAGLHFALGRANVELADLDGHLGLGGDPTTAALRLDEGVLFPSPEPGLGWTPD